MFVSIITDCTDPNAVGRLSTRHSALLDCATNVVPVTNDIEAAGNLIDMLDAGNGETGAVIANIAPRHGSSQKWGNGAPFGYFFYKDTLVLSTIDGQTLSLVKKLKLTDQIELLDLEKVVKKFGDKWNFSEDTQFRLSRTQFRSFEVTPYLVRHLLGGGDVESEPTSLQDVPAMSRVVWWVDNFGNCKTSILSTDMAFTKGKVVPSKVGDLTCYQALHQVPDGQKGLIEGSSGIESHRFLEVVIQGDSAAAKLGLEVGTQVM